MPSAPPRPSGRPPGSGWPSGAAGTPGQARADTQERHDHHGQVARVHQQLERCRRVAVPEETVQHVAERAALRQQAARVPHRRVQHREPAQLLQVLDGVGQEAGGKHHQEHADHREEPAQVQPVAQAVDHEGQPQRARQADRGTGQCPGRRGGEDDRQREDNGLQAFPAHCLEREQAEAPPRPAVEGCLGPSPQFRGQGPGVRAHPERHVREHGGRDQERGRLEDRLDARSVVAANRRVRRRTARARQYQRRPTPANTSLKCSRCPIRSR